MIAREVRLFLVALQFLTRLPVPAIASFEPEWLDRAAKYFPVVGALVGICAALVLLAGSLLAPQPIPIVLALGVAVALTGAMHEDGLADTADGLGGGATREQQLEIMKDSRVGTYGVVALALTLGLKFAALSAMDPFMAAMALIAAHAGGRMAAVVAMRVLLYAGDASAAKVPPLTTAARNGELAIAVGLGSAIGLAVLPVGAVLTATVLGLIASAWLAHIAHRRLQGYTGDVLGGIEQVFEASFLAAAAAVIAGPG